MSFNVMEYTSTTKVRLDSVLIAAFQAGFRAILHLAGVQHQYTTEVNCFIKTKWMCRLRHLKLQSMALRGIFRQPQRY